MRALTTCGKRGHTIGADHMPWVTIKTGIASADGQETVLTEYLCDWPDCAHVAVHVVSAVRAAGLSFAVCAEHAAMMRSGNHSAQESDDEADDE